MYYRSVCGLAVLCLLPLHSTIGQTLSVNFHVGSDADAQAEHELTAGETAGFVPVDGQFWNNIDVANAGGNAFGSLIPSTPLVDNTGSNAATISTVDTTWFVGYNASRVLEAFELGLPGNDDDLFNSYLALNGPAGDGDPADAAVINLTGIDSSFTSAPGGYDLILYSDSDRGGFRTAGNPLVDTANEGNRQSQFVVTPGGGSAITVFTEDDYFGAPEVRTFDGTYVLSDGVEDGEDYSNYVIVSGLTASSLTIDLSSADGGRGAINGFQLVVGLTATPAVPGDVDNDGDVDTDDFAIIRDNFRNNVPLFTDGDLTGPSGLRDGVVNFYDFIEWSTEFQSAGGSMTGISLFATTPEPCGIALAMSAFAFTPWARRRRLAPLCVGR